MATIAKVTVKGQTTIPQEVRAALHIKPGDLLIVAAFAVLSEAEAVVHKPRVVLLNERNEALPQRDEVPDRHRRVGDRPPAE